MLNNSTQDLVMYIFTYFNHFYDNPEIPVIFVSNPVERSQFLLTFHQYTIKRLVNQDDKL